MEKEIIKLKQRILRGELDTLKINFNTNPTQGQMMQLGSEFPDRIWDYEVMGLDVNKVVSKIIDGEKKYKTNDLVVDSKTVNLIKHIEAGNKIIPPILIYINQDCWKDFDGQHRIGLFRFLKLSQAPFLIRKWHSKYADKLK